MIHLVLTSRRRLLLSGLGGLLLLIGDAAMTLAVNQWTIGVLDQHNDTPGIPHCLGAEYKAQTFTAGVSGLLTDVELGLGPVFVVGTFEIRAVDGVGAPTGPTLASGPNALIGYGGWAHWPLPTPLAVVAGTTYAVVATYSCDAPYAAAWFSSATDYSGGAGYVSADGSSWSLASSFESYGTDFNFQTWVEPATTTTITSVDHQPSVIGQPVTVHVSVTPTGVGANGDDPIGDITVEHGSDTCHITAPSGSCTFTPTSAGSAPITAAFTHAANPDGGGQFLDSASEPTPHAVVRAATSVVLRSSPQPSVYRQAVHLVARVSSTATGLGKPTGTVDFRNGRAAICRDVPIDSTGRATCDIPHGLPVGSNRLTARYSGDDDYTPSTGPVRVQYVNRAATTIRVSASSDPVTDGQRITLSAVVRTQALGRGIPRGDVQFTIDGHRLVPQVVLVNGRATLSLTVRLSVGSHQLRAFFVGTVDYAASSSPGYLLYVR